MYTQTAGIYHLLGSHLYAINSKQDISNLLSNYSHNCHIQALFVTGCRVKLEVKTGDKRDKVLAATFIYPLLCSAAC